MSVETLTLQKPEPSSEPPHLLPEPEMDYNNEFTDWESTFNFFANELLNEDPCTYQGASTPNTGGLPTPPCDEPMSDSSDSDTIVSVSTVFYPGAPHTKAPPDLILLSKDSVFFYVHWEHLVKDSSNQFNYLLPRNPPGTSHDGTHPIIMLPESSQVLNVLLHTLYDIPFRQFSPSADITVDAVHCLRSYGFSVKSFVYPSSSLYELILSRAPLYPIELYAIASEYDLNELATTISPHVLGYDLSRLTDALSTQIGPIYLKRLFFLHLGRSNALKRLLLSPPPLHAQTSECDFDQQRKLTRAWALATAYLSWEAKPDLPTSSIETALGSLHDHLTCEMCRHGLTTRVRQLVVDWSNVKRTI